MNTLAWAQLALLSSLLLVAAQSSSSSSASLSDCHQHGATQYCVLPNGEETAITTSGIPAATAPSQVVASPTAAAQSTAVTDCHLHESATYCVDGNGQEVEVSGTGTVTGEPAAQYTDCHPHGNEGLYCSDPDGAEVLVSAKTEDASDGSNSEAAESNLESGGQTCHYHAGVEHCDDDEGAEGQDSPSCELTRRDYNTSLRIGTLFVILVTSSIASFGPIVLTRLLHLQINNLVFIVLKQFGTGVIFATAFIHLTTHAQLMFANPCLGQLAYEPTTTSIIMAGAFLSFLIEYVGNRFVASRRSKEAEPNEVPTSEKIERESSSGASGTEPPHADQTKNVASFGHHHGLLRPDDKLSVLVMEAGILFHSILIGLTLMVAGDSAYVSLFIVILFHQMFEGLALGTRISTLGGTSGPVKLLLAGAYALITPLGMAIGLAVIRRFNGNDPATIVAIGTLDALSAGILVWVSVVDMWSYDWLFGSLSRAGAVHTTVGMTSLVAGMVLMGLLGKWA
ncbi:MAG: hypothetical protein M1817_002795 [Caeruleum heppii]|nr:MAG: hypothetical protein M1817_002795 [Caeruleum heppii]